MGASTSVVAKATVLIAGNLLVLVLEGMVVSIQTTRLVLFEFFTRFLAAPGPHVSPVAGAAFRRQGAFMKSRMRFALALVALAGALALFGTLLLTLAPSALAAETSGTGAATNLGNAGYAFLAAAISTALAALGAGFAVAKVGAAAIGALAEKPELFGRLLIFVGLAEGIAIYGLIVSILILNRLV